MKSRAKRIFVFCLALVLALMMVVPSLTMIAWADDGDEIEEAQETASDTTEANNQISQLSNRYKELQAQQTQIQNQLNQTKSQKEQKQAVGVQLGNQIATTAEQIEVLEEKLDLLDSRIKIKEREMKAKQQEIDTQYDQFKKRLRAMTANRQATNVGLVLGADSYSEFLTRSEITTRVAQYDNDVIDFLTQEKQELDEIKKAIEQDKVDAEKDKEELDARKAELDTQYKEIQSQIHDLAAMEKEYLANKDKLQKQMSEVQAQINKIYEEINKNNQSPYVGGEMQWPCPTLSQITSSFGWRFGGSDYHTGIDISGAGAYGARVTASNTGTVAFVNHSFTPGYGYGKYLIIDHGGGRSTLYAHCSDILVQKGQVVAVGETIAKVGSTGWSTGPHLHFEVRINGKAQNPINYLSK